MRVEIPPDQSDEKCKRRLKQQRDNQRMPTCGVIELILSNGQIDGAQSDHACPGDERGQKKTEDT